MKLRKNIISATDLNGISLVNKKDSTHLFIEYPEAAVWSILIKNQELKKSVKMLQAILDKNEDDTHIYICQCLKTWKESKIIL
jgi:hypothetical protein